MCTYVAGYAQGKEALSIEQLAEGMPAGIISPVPGVRPAILEESGSTVDNPSFSPDSTMIAYTKASNLYVVDVVTGEHRALTTDGSDLILNGRSSWVYYEEILGRATHYKAFWWSPDSRRLAYCKFDDTEVPMFPIYDAKGKYGTLKETRYPKAGDANPKVETGMVDLATGETVWADFDRWEQIYFQPFDGSYYVKITEGCNWGTRILKLDERNGVLFFQNRDIHEI